MIMSDGEPSQKKQKVEEIVESDNDSEDESKDESCNRCGYDHADDGVDGDFDCIRNWRRVIYTNTEGYNSSEWICEDVPFTEYLKTYKPEKKVDKVGSFLVLGELCQNLITYTQIIKHYGEPRPDVGQFDFKLFEIFRRKLKVIQDICLKKAQEVLEKWQRDGNGSDNLVFKDLFLGNWKEAGSIGRLEKHEKEDMVNLNTTFRELSTIYVSLRDIEHGAYCDFHPKCGSMIEPDEGEMDQINKNMKEFELDEFWSKMSTNE